MLVDDKRIKIAITLLLTLIFIIGSSFILTQEISNVEKSISAKAMERARKINEKMVLIQSFMNTLHNNMQAYIELHSTIEHSHPAVDYIKNYPEYNVAAIDSRLSTEKLNFVGTFSTLDTKEQLTDDVIQEISAALLLRLTFLSAVDSIADLKWVYYISAKRFMYTVPYHSVSLFHLNETNYNKEYWVGAIPENNPERHMVMTNIYQDGAGKGYLATLSVPIYVNDTFKGIIGIDISLDAFIEIMAMNTMLGDSFLLDENKVILATDTEGEQGQILYIPPNNLNHSMFINDDNAYDYVSYEIIKDEVTFVHRLERHQKYKAAFINSLRELFLLLSSVIMAYMIYYFRVLIIRVGLLANIDPLTSLLNRRAMENAVLPLLSVNERYEQKMCFLLADIDYFKKVNDNYGHQVGDEVLVSVTEILSSCLRSSDLLSRHGGEEFLIVLPQTDLESGSLLAERIRTSIENTRTGDNRVGVTLSIGCVEVRKEESFDSVLSRADKMLYKAKIDGRNLTMTDSNV